MLSYCFPVLKNFASSVQKMDTKELCVSEGPTAKMLGNLFAVHSIPSLNTDSLRLSIQYFEDYVRTGVYDEDEAKRLMRETAQTLNSLAPVRKDYEEGRIADKYGFGAPIALFVHGYAHRAVLTVTLLEQYFEQAHVPDFQRKLERKHLSRLILNEEPPSAPAP